MDTILCGNNGELEVGVRSSLWEPEKPVALSSVHQWSSKCGPQTGRISISWEAVRSTDFHQATQQACGIRNPAVGPALCALTRPQATDAH